jgi:hypothetical protein
VRAHREGVRHFKAHREQAIKVLQDNFGHSPEFAAKTFDDYIVCMDESLQVDLQRLELLVSQVAPDARDDPKQVAEGWIVPGALKGQAPLAP